MKRVARPSGPGWQTLADSSSWTMPWRSTSNACHSDQSALELPSPQPGLLTYSLLEGLKSAPPNSRQQVTVSGLVYFVWSAHSPER
jgi:hypothetical protein